MTCPDIEHLNALYADKCQRIEAELTAQLTDVLRRNETDDDYTQLSANEREHLKIMPQYMSSELLKFLDHNTHDHQFLNLCQKFMPAVALILQGCPDKISSRKDSWEQTWLWGRRKGNEALNACAKILILKLALTHLARPEASGHQADYDLPAITQKLQNAQERTLLKLGDAICSVERIGSAFEFKAYWTIALMMGWPFFWDWNSQAQESLRDSQTTQPASFAYALITGICQVYMWCSLIYIAVHGRDALHDGRHLFYHIFNPSPPEQGDFAPLIEAVRKPYTPHSDSVRGTSDAEARDDKRPMQLTKTEQPKTLQARI